MNRTKKFWIAVIVVSGLLMTALPANAQKRRPTRVRTTKKIIPKKQTIRTVSGGVVNGRAINLVGPEYPKSASILRLRGIVNISVSIDENGTVINTRILSGHPLLVASAKRAASVSAFAPLTIGGLPVRVSGQITYYFHNNELNWLEIGYTTESPYLNERNKLGSFLPPEFESQKQLWDQYMNDETGRRGEILASFASAVESQLINDAKSLWLYRLGRALGSVRYNLDKCEDSSCSRLDDLLKPAPSCISPILNASVQGLIDARDDRVQFKRKNAALFQRLYGLGR